MTDPLSEIVSLLNPQVAFSKMVHGAGEWRIQRENSGDPFYCVVIKGECILHVGVKVQHLLTAGDFVLIPEAFDFTFSSINPMPSEDLHSVPELMSPGVFRIGDNEQTSKVQLLVGHCRFDSLDAKILISLLPKLVHIRSASRLKTLVEIVIQESLTRPPGYEKVLAHLIEVILIEAFRTKVDTPSVPGLLVGLADERLVGAIRTMHQDVSQAKTISQLAKAAALSRSAFFHRFSQAVGVTPMEYQIAWRMTIAKDLLKKQLYTMAEIAERIGYKSASAFSLAFTKYTGQAPSKFKNSA
jgi:AraC-like DNA-binding protein